MASNAQKHTRVFSPLQQLLSQTTPSRSFSCKGPVFSVPVPQLKQTFGPSCSQQAPRKNRLHLKFGTAELRPWRVWHGRQTKQHRPSSRRWSGTRDGACERAGVWVGVRREARSPHQLSSQQKHMTQLTQLQTLGEREGWMSMNFHKPQGQTPPCCS